MPAYRRASAQLASATDKAGAATAATAATTAAKAAPAGVRVLKKYPNRRLYDTRSSGYITLADVKRMVLAAEDFQVIDAKTGDDLTRSILLQIILEEESGGVPMFSSQALAQIIRFYGHSMQGVMGTMLEKNLQAFTELQGQFMSQSNGLYDPQQLSPELWAQFMQGQAPMLQSLMGGYLNHSRTVFEQMQEQVKKAGALFPGVPGFPTPR
jgi:polyhydroxyalkanoate synthesis repressor PhaR